MKIMTIDEAIKFAEYAPTLTDISEVKEFYRMCGEALRAQQPPAKLDRSRWEGCPNCHRWQVYGYRNYEPAYCRDCGKPLNEPAWVELERRIGGSDGTTDV